MENNHTETLSTHSNDESQIRVVDNMSQNNTLFNKNSSFDQITLELMCNKKKYNKIIEKTNPKKFEENREQTIKLNKYSNKIMNITNQLLESPEIQITNEINNAFEEYSKICIRYFEMKEYESKYNHDSEDKDMMFDKIDDSYKNKEKIDPFFTPSKSYWGKSIHKI